MKMKLTQPGFENLTGRLGITEFVDGTSVNDITFEEFAGLANIYQAEYTVETAEPVVEPVTPVIEPVVEPIAPVEPVVPAAE